jgi:NAD(P)-dependent dehydrogenase (short-subunit alcohol dehydrogenase family)
MKKGDIVLITGGNSGIGKATAIGLAQMGAKVIIVCRNKERGEKALRDIIEKSNNQTVELYLCDLSSLEDIRRFSNLFKTKYNRIDILINNAGVIASKRQLTKDGYELQFGVNHLGHFLLTNLLLDELKKSNSARIINVASGAHKIGKINFDDINLTKKYSTFGSYAQSKLANVLFTFELSRRLQKTNITVNCLHPGGVGTNIALDRESGFRKIITYIMGLVLMTPEKGAQTSIYLATSNDVEGITGKYYYKKKIAKSSKLTYDIDYAKRLWDLSIKMAGNFF